MAAKNEKQTGTALAKQEETATGIISQNAEVLAALEQDALAPEMFGRDDIAVPFIRILQSNSPEVKRSEAKFIEGAQEGDFFNTASLKIYKADEGVIVVPVFYTKSFTEWKPRTAGGGLVKDHGSDSSILEQTTKNDKKKDVLPNGNEVVSGALYYLLIVDPKTGEFEQAAMVLTSTQLKKARRWNSVMASLTVKHPKSGQPMRVQPYYMAYQLSTVAEKNDQGSWMGIKIEQFKPTLELPFGAGIFFAARDMQAAVSKGEIKVKAESATEAELGDPEASEVTFGDGDGSPAEELPF